MKSLSCELPRVNLSYNHLLVPIHGQLELGMQLILEVKHHDVCDYPTQHLSHLHLQLTFLATWCVGFLLQWLWKTNISSNTTCFVPTGQCHLGRPASAIRSQCDNPCTLRLPALDCVISYKDMSPGTGNRSFLFSPETVLLSLQEPWYRHRHLEKAPLWEICAWISL